MNAIRGLLSNKFIISEKNKAHTRTDRPRAKIFTRKLKNKNIYTPIAKIKEYKAPLEVKKNKHTTEIEDTKIL
ncbi:hypothetical protein D3C85_1350220 [compost metagenome]